MIGEITGVWEPVVAERRAAWELYVELVTRISVADLRSDEGILREALTSLHSLFGTTREILRRYGPDVAMAGEPGEITFGRLAVAVLNGALRPALSRWHPQLAAYEAIRPAEADPVQYERAWPRAEELRTELNEVRKVLTGLARTLGQVSGVDDLSAIAAPPPTSPAPPVPPAPHAPPSALPDQRPERPGG
jgi:hypothetical protein